MEMKGCLRGTDSWRQVSREQLYICPLPLTEYCARGALTSKLRKQDQTWESTAGRNESHLLSEWKCHKLNCLWLCDGHMTETVVGKKNYDCRHLAIVNIHASTHSDRLCTTWYPKPAALLVRSFQATGSTLKQSAAFNTEEWRTKNHMVFK